MYTQPVASGLANAFKSSHGWCLKDRNIVSKTQIAQHVEQLSLISLSEEPSTPDNLLGLTRP